MPSTSAPSRHDFRVVDEMKLKIQLLESDNKANNERTERILRENKEVISRLRKQNKEHRKVLSKTNTLDADSMEEHLVNMRRERIYLATKPVESAVGTLDEKFFDSQKTLNLLKFENVQKMGRLEDLRKQNCMLYVGDDEEGDGVVAVSKSGGRKREADLEMKFRMVENELDKTRVKCGEAEHMHKTYLQIRGALENEHKDLHLVLDQADNEITRLEEQMEKLKPMLTEASKSRDAAKDELEGKEKKVALERRTRGEGLVVMRKKVEKRKKYEETLRNGRSASSSPPRPQKQADEGGEEGRVERLEEVLMMIKRSVGVSDTQWLVKRFEEQKSRQEQLKEMKSNNEAAIERLEGDKDRLFQRFRSLEFSRGVQANGDDGSVDVSVVESVDDEDEESEYKKKQFETEMEKKRMATKMQERVLDVEKMEGLMVEFRVGVNHLVERLLTVQETQSLPIGDDSASEIEKVENNLGDGDDFYGDDENVNLLKKLHLCRNKLLYLCQKEKELGKHMNDEVGGENVADSDKFKTYNENEDSVSMGNVSRVSKDSTSRSDAKEAEEDEEETEDDEWMVERERMKKKSLELLERKMANAKDKKKM